MRSQNRAFHPMQSTLVLMIVIVSMTGVTACGDEARSTSSSARDVIELNEWRPSEILPNTDGSVLAILGRTTGHKQGITLDLGKTDLAPDKQIVSVAWLSNDRLAAGEWIADSNTSAIIELTVAGDSKGVPRSPGCSDWARSRSHLIIGSSYSRRQIPQISAVQLRCIGSTSPRM